MRQTDIAIVGGGLAGSTAAAMLGHAGHNAVLIDPHPAYPPDFRCEKLDRSQVELAHRTGLGDAVRRAATVADGLWVARFGRLVDRRPNDQYDILYPSLVNTMRAEIPATIPLIEAKATAITTGAERQRVTLSNGEEIEARLVVLANGLNIGLRHTLGIQRNVVSENHSISIGFDVAPVSRPAFDFPALTYYGERAADRIAYLTLFPVQSSMRANLFVYRDMRDPWLREMRQNPEAALRAIMPGLGKLLGDFKVVGDVKIRPVDLYVTEGHRQAGIVLVGDAYATSCPAAGTGANKVLTDVERLCHVYIPRWLASEGMGAEKISAFYADPAKIACDAQSTAKAYHLRTLSLGTALPWVARRWSKFVGQYAVGTLRDMRERLTSRPAAGRRPAPISAADQPTR